MFGQQENENENEGKIEQGSVYSIYLSIYIYIPSDYMITVDARESIQEGNLPFI